MNKCRAATLIILALISVSDIKIYSQNQVEYVIRIEIDGSAVWTIEQTVSINDTYDELDQFQARVVSLGAAAKAVTGRTMLTEAKSMSAVVIGSYVSVEYSFYWTNFSRVETENIAVGDVFHVEGFFNHLYGDGAIQLIYPQQYTVETVSPAPSKRDDPAKILEWPGTADFNGKDVIILFKKNSVSPGFLDVVMQNALLITVVIGVAVASSVGIYTRRRRGKMRSQASQPIQPLDSLQLVSDKEKIVKMLESVGGSVLQSAITEHFRFSRAKTSQLLTALENEGVVRRHRKGRDKVVTLVQETRVDKR
jgi:uncharacterized membrane protein